MVRNLGHPLKPKEYIYIYRYISIDRKYKVICYSPSPSHSQTNWDWPPRSRQGIHPSADRITVSNDRNPPARPYRTGPVYKARRQSSPSPHSYRIQLAHIPMEICSLCMKSVGTSCPQRHRRRPHTWLFACLLKIWWFYAWKNRREKELNDWLERGFTDWSARVVKRKWKCFLFSFSIFWLINRFRNILRELRRKMNHGVVTPTEIA